VCGVGQMLVCRRLCDRYMALGDRFSGGHL
jgi:hypothetical protein